MNLGNQIRSLRHSRQLTQQQLADQAGISRQTVSSVEGGGMVPSVLVALELARALQCSVEQIFSLEDEAPPVLAEVPKFKRPAPVWLAKLDETLWAWPLGEEGPVQAADAIWYPDGNFARLHDRSPNQTLVLLGCHPGLHLLEGYLQRRNDPIRVIARLRNSLQAVLELTYRKAHAAGVHLYDPKSRNYNLPLAKEVLEAEGGLLVHFARWEEGICFRPETPIRKIADLARQPLRVVGREEGSEAHNLLCRQLATIDSRLLTTIPHVAKSHGQVAKMVQDSLADAGITVRYEAEMRGLGFFPLAEESFDLLVPARLLKTPPVLALLEVLADERFRQEMATLGSDANRSGTVLWSTPVPKP